MNIPRRTKRLGLVVLTLGVVALGACSSKSGSSPSESVLATSPSVPSSVAPSGAAVPSAGATAAGDTGCKSAIADGTASNAAMQQVATNVYRSINCAGATTMTVQLEAALKDPALESRVKAAGASMFGGSTASGSAITISDGKSVCQVVVIDSMGLKKLHCADA